MFVQIKSGIVNLDSIMYINFNEKDDHMHEVVMFKPYSYLYIDDEDLNKIKNAMKTYNSSKFNYTQEVLPC